MHGYPDAGTHRYDGTVAWADMDGQGYLGIASTMPGYTQEDRDAANAMRDRLVQSDPSVMATDNVGRKPNDSLYHAETTALMRAARSNGGSLSGRNIDMYVDRRMCDSCDDVLPLLSRELGHPTVRFTDIYGRRRTLRNGRWE
jgi:MafB19-like deaminase